MLHNLQEFLSGLADDHRASTRQLKMGEDRMRALFER